MKGLVKTRQNHEGGRVQTHDAIQEKAKRRKATLNKRGKTL